MIAFTSEDNSCDFAIRDPRGTDNFALINKHTLAYRCLTPELATRQQATDGMIAE